MPKTDLQPNQKETLVQVFVIDGIVVHLPKPMMVLFEGPAGMRPWVDWDSATRLKIKSEVERVGKVSTRAIA